MLGCFFQMLKDFLSAVLGLIIIGFIISLFIPTNTDTNTKKTSYNNKYDVKIIDDFVAVHKFMYIHTEGLSDYCSMYGYVPNKYINLFKKKFYNTERYAYARLENSLNPDDKKDMGRFIDNINRELKTESIEYFNKGFEDFSRQYSGQTQNNYCRLYDIIPNEVLNKQKEMLIKFRPHIYVE